MLGVGEGEGLGWGLMVVGMGIDVGGDGDGVPITFDDNEWVKGIYNPSSRLYQRFRYTVSNTSIIISYYSIYR